mgnify:CR=1 FL=1
MKKTPARAFFLGKITAHFYCEIVMAVINCPNCKKKISSKAKTCSYCAIDLTSMDEEKIESIRQSNRIKQSQRMMNYSFIAMLLFCGGFLFMFWQNLQPGTWQYMLALISTVSGFVLYIVTRIRLIFLKKSAK